MRRPTARRATATRRPGCRPTRASAAPTSRARCRSSSSTRSRSRPPSATRCAGCWAGARPSAWLREALLEPVMGVGLVVEGLDLDVACRAIEAARFLQGSVGLQAQEADAAPARALLDLAEDTPADAEAAGAGRHPHALDLGRLAAVELQRSAADRLAAQAGDQQQPGGLGELVDVSRDALLGIEAGVEADVELRGVGLDAEAGSRAGGGLGVDGDEAPRE